MISNERIKKLSGRQGVCQEHVRNFLDTVQMDEELDLKRALELAVAEQRFWEWNDKTVAAVQTGILEHFAT